MTTYAILDESLQFVEWRDFDTFPVSKPGRVLLQVVDDLPVFDANTSKLAEDVPVVGVADVRKTWKIIPLSQIELKLIEDGVLYDQAKAVYLDLKNGVGTQAQRIARIEAVLAWILKRIALLEKGEIVG